MVTSSTEGAAGQEAWQGDPFRLGDSFCDFGRRVFSFAEGKGGSEDHKVFHCPQYHSMPFALLQS